MNNKNEIVEQTNLAFDFIEKLYLESSYLIKEIEGILNEEEEKFIIGKTGGYAISTSTSKGLEPNNVKSWLLKNFSVFFIPEGNTKPKGGVTFTKINDNLKVIYLRIVFYGKNIKEPMIYSGVLFNVEKKQGKTFPTKFEQVMSHIEYNDKKFFNKKNQINYEDIYLKIQGELIKNCLFEITDSESIVKKIIEPSLELYRKY